MTCGNYDKAPEPPDKLFRKQNFFNQLLKFLWPLSVLFIIMEQNKIFKKSLKLQNSTEFEKLYEK